MKMLLLVLLCNQFGGHTDHRDLLDRTVRISVYSGNTADIGTGTVINNNGKTVIITCKHLLSPNISGVMIEGLFKNSIAQFVTTKISSWEYSAWQDFMVITIPDVIKCKPAHIGNRGDLTKQLFTVGCNEGSSPTVVSTSLISDNKAWITEKKVSTYQLEIAGVANNGRSGGPIYNSRGVLVGVLWGSSNTTSAVNLTTCKEINKWRKVSPVVILSTPVFD